ncbi:MAG: MASE1 domain-containing protein [Steroidobacteraceae bacterium]
MLERFRRLIEAMSASNRNAALGYGLVHLLAALVGELIAEPGGRYSGLWPGVGAQGAFLVMLPTSRWWVIVLVGLLVEAIVDILRFLPQYGADPELLFAFPYAAIDAATALLAAAVYRGIAGRAAPVLRSFVAPLFAVAAALFAGAVLGALWLGWIATDAPFLPTLVDWFGADLLGVLAVGTPLLNWWYRALGYRGPRTGSQLELLLLAVVALAAATLIFLDPEVSRDFELPYLLFPVVLWAATRFYPALVVTGTGLLAIYITWLFNRVTQPRVSASTTFGPQDLFPLQLFLGVLLVTAVLLSIALNDRRLLQQRLREMLHAVGNAEREASQRAAVELREEIDGPLARVQEKLHAILPRVTDGPQLDTLRDAESLVAGMRRSASSLLEDLTPAAQGDAADLLGGLQSLFDRFGRERGLAIGLQVHGALDAVPIERAQLVLRIVQELLLNVARHAGVRRAQVRLRQSGDGILVEVLDDGRGFDTRPFEDMIARGFGLFSIRDQVIEEGGSFELHSAPGKGCRVRVRLPDA